MEDKTPIKTFHKKRFLMNAIQDIADTTQIKSVRWCGFNGGSTLDDLIEIIKPSLAENFTFEVLTWDLRTSDLLPKDDLVEAAYQKVKSLETALGSLAIDTFGSPYANPSEIFSEYLMLGSEVLKKPGHQYEFLKGISPLMRKLSGVAETRNGTVIARKAPHYVPCLFIIIDEHVFVRLYTDTVLGVDEEPDIYLTTDASNVLHRILSAHFNKVWSEASGSICAPIGKGAASEIDHWEQHNQIRLKREAEVERTTPRIFISYRQNDTSWACTRLFEYLAMVYGRNAVFLDNESIPGSTKFDDIIPQEAKRSDIMLVVMGEHWSSPANLDKLNLRTTDQDFVRDELEIALDADNDISILPILVDTNAFPLATDLPETVREFVKFNNNKHLEWKHFNTSAKKITEEIDRLWLEKKT
jgi:hypothetical protein